MVRKCRVHPELRSCRRRGQFALRRYTNFSASVRIDINQTVQTGHQKKETTMTEVHFLVEETPEGGFVARAMGADIFTEADDMQALHAQVCDAVHCHFGAATLTYILSRQNRGLRR